MNALVSSAAITAATPLALAQPAADPIFQAIELHKAAFRAWAVSLHLWPDDDNIVSPACHAETDAAVALTNVVPTSMPGVLALLAYVDEFNRGHYCNPDGRPASEHYLWPEDLEDDSVLFAEQRPLHMPWAFWIMRNVHQALQKLTERA